MTPTRFGVHPLDAGLWQHCRNITSENLVCQKLTINKTYHGFTVRPLDNIWDFPPNDIFIPRRSLQLTRGQCFPRESIFWFARDYEIRFLNIDF